MKRRGWLIEKIADFDNLRLAFWKAKKGKSLSKEVRDFVEPTLDFNLRLLHDNILDGTARLGHYHFFRIYDPKERLVCAAPFEQRVLHHAIINVCHEDFERHLIADTYASRLGRGTYKALELAYGNQRKYRYCLKLDIRKYFDSIDHLVLYEMLTKLFKDPTLLELFNDIIESYCSSPGKGVPIGNLTSQYFANHYLSVFDHLVKHTWRIKGYVRYMDDMIIWGNSLSELKETARNARAFLKDKLLLDLKVCQIKPTSQRTTFLGYQISNREMRLAKRSVARYKKHLKGLFYLYGQGMIDQEEMNRRLQPILAFVDKVDSKGIKRQALLRCYN